MRMFRFLLPLLHCVFCCQFAAGQLFISAGSMGTAGVTSVGPLLGWSPLLPATMTEETHSSASMGLNQRYLIPELSCGAFSFVKPYKRNWFGFSIVSSGYHNYRESRFKLAYAKKLSRSVSIGGGVNYCTTSIKELNRRNSYPLADAGILIECSSSLKAHIHVTGIQKNSELIKNENIIAGLQFQVGDKVNLRSEIRKAFVERSSLGFGIEYLASNSIIRCGFTTAPVSFASGYGFKRNNLLLEFALSYDPRLGPSNAISFSWIWE